MMNVKGLFGDILLGAFSPLCQAFNSGDAKGGLDFVHQMEVPTLADDILCETTSAICADSSIATLATTTSEVVSGASELLATSCSAVQTDSKSQVGAVLTVGLASACFYLLSKASSPPGVLAPIPANGPMTTLNHINVRVSEFVSAPFPEQKKFLDRMIPLTQVANSTESKMPCLVCEETACVRTYPCSHNVSCSECDYVWEISMLQTKIQQLKIDGNVIMNPAFFATYKIPQCMLCRSKITSRVCLR